jgi:hypothetical protein
VCHGGDSIHAAETRGARADQRYSVHVVLKAGAGSKLLTPSEQYAFHPACPSTD